MIMGVEYSKLLLQYEKNAMEISTLECALNLLFEGVVDIAYVVWFVGVVFQCGTLAGL